MLLQRETVLGGDTFNHMGKLWFSLQENFLPKDVFSELHYTLLLQWCKLFISFFSVFSAGSQCIQHMCILLMLWYKCFSLVSRMLLNIS